MKKITSFLSLLLIMSLGHLANAQEKGTSDLSASVGFETSTELSELFSDIVVTSLTGGQYRTDNTSASPTFGITYRYAIKNRWMIHADGFFQKISKDVYDGDIKTGDLENSYFTVGFGTDYRYISKGIFQMYSGVAIAYTSESVDYTGPGEANDGDSFFNYQVNALGFRVGNAFAAFSEIGFGYRGILNAGLSYQF